MRIGFLTYGLDRAPTGIGRYAVELLRALAALLDGPDIVLLTTEGEDRQGLWGEFERYALPGCRLLPALITAGHAAVSLASRRLGLDLVHDPNGIAPFLGPSGGARRVVTIHDAFPYVQPETHNRLDNWRYRWQLPNAARRADAVVTDSECSRRDLVRFLGLSDDLVHLIPAGVDFRFEPVAEGPQRRAALGRYGVEPPYVLYTGGINARKNIARLLDAYASICEQHPGLRLVIAGKLQWQTSEVGAALRRLNLGERVRFTGYVDDADLPALYSGAELFVFPSLYEGFGLPPLEAMACGTPVVTSNVSSLPEVVGDAAVVVNPYDAADLAAAMQRVLTDASLRADLRRLGIARARQFTWERTARQTRALYFDVLEKTTGSVTEREWAGEEYRNEY